MESTAKLIIDGKAFELPIVESTEGEWAIDISNLRKATGLITLESGHGNTGSCESINIFIDGEKEIPRSCGISVEQLAEPFTKFLGF